ncbi:hypothetical protein P3T29_000051 [Kitasatospora sp. MAP5-34]|nr:hypothetical protein [Kitasatospora sp. MAP5-34]
MPGAEATGSRNPRIDVTGTRVTPNAKADPITPMAAISSRKRRRARG